MSNCECEKAQVKAKAVAPKHWNIQFLCAHLPFNGYTEELARQVGVDLPLYFCLSTSPPCYSESHRTHCAL